MSILNRKLLIEQIGNKIKINQTQIFSDKLLSKAKLLNWWIRS